VETDLAPPGAVVDTLRQGWARVDELELSASQWLGGPGQATVADHGEASPGGDADGGVGPVPHDALVARPDAVPDACAGAPHILSLRFSHVGVSDAQGRMAWGCGPLMWSLSLDCADLKPLPNLSAWWGGVRATWAPDEPLTAADRLRHRRHACSLDTLGAWTQAPGRLTLSCRDEDDIVLRVNAWCWMACGDTRLFPVCQC
jgi:hypothetical protein